jgi:hypothetical protein
LQNKPDLTPETTHDGHFDGRLLMEVSAMPTVKLTPSAHGSKEILRKTPHSKGLALRIKQINLESLNWNKRVLRVSTCTRVTAKLS